MACEFLSGAFLGGLDAAACTNTYLTAHPSYNTDLMIVHTIPTSSLLLNPTPTISYDYSHTPTWTFLKSIVFLQLFLGTGLLVDCCMHGDCIAFLGSVVLRLEQRFSRMKVVVAANASAWEREGKCTLGFGFTAGQSYQGSRRLGA
jgi:hypothetical protein